MPTTESKNDDKKTASTSLELPKNGSNISCKGEFAVILKINIMIFYNLDTKFFFGKFEGKTVREVLEIQHSYIDWCAIHLDHFFISDEVIEEIRSITPDFSISEEGQNKLFEKYETWENEQEDYEFYDNDDYYPDYERDTFYALTDGQYGDYDDFRENGGDMGRLRDALGF
jgi:hypothetical protein